MGVQKQCLLRVVDTCARGFVITKPMLAKDNGRIKGKRDLMTKPMLAKSERHESKPSAIVMTKAVLAKSKRQLCKHQTFVRKTTRYRTYESRVEAPSSPSRAVVSCDF